MKDILCEYHRNGDVESVHRISLVALEKAAIEGALSKSSGNVVEAARLLHIGRGSLRCKMRRHGIGNPREERVTSPARQPA